MQRNRIVKGLLGGLLVVAMLLSVLPTLVAPAAATAATTWYVSYLGGTGTDGTSNMGIAVDSAGYAYITGRTNSANFPTTPGAYQTTNAGGNDAFVTKFDPSGNLVYSTYLGGTGVDYGYAIAVDSAGNIYVTGRTDSTDFPVTPSAYQAARAGTFANVFVTKFDSSWNLAYSTYLGGPTGGASTGMDIAVDNNGNIWVTGQTNSSDFPTTPGAYQTTSGSPGGVQDAFVTKFDSSGNLAYSTYLGEPPLILDMVLQLMPRETSASPDKQALQTSPLPWAPTRQPMQAGMTPL